MIAQAAVLCLVLFSSDHLAAASKSFGGGYGGESSSVGQREPETWAGPLLTPDAVIPPVIPKPNIGYSYPAADSPPATPSPKTSNNNKGYGGSGTPRNEKKAAPAAASSSGGNNGGGVGSSPSYGLDPAGEPEYGLNQRAIDDILREHNLFRAKEHVPPLSWNATLAKFSQNYAETLKTDCRMVHSTSPYGENLMLGSGGVTWKTTVDEWSGEKKSYHYGSNSCDAGKMCGHYTAVVWKGTTTVGCGRVVCNNGDTMIMCSYWPPGNYDGVKPF